MHFHKHVQEPYNPLGIAFKYKAHPNLDNIKWFLLRIATTNDHERISRKRAEILLRNLLLQRQSKSDLNEFPDHRLTL